MTIARYCGELSVRCDGDCGEELTESDLEVEGFDELVEAIRADEWSITKVGGEWRHHCPDCQE